MLRRVQGRKGFTLVEIMIVVTIIGLLAAIAIPSFVKSRAESQKNVCLNNLRQIDSAKEQWALATGKVGGAASVEAEINEYIKKVPACPAGGSYTYGAVGADPTCSVALHALP